MMAFERAFLSPRQAFEYKWNTTCNVNGGAEKNIPDDNLVELHVKMLKEQLACQGSKVSFESAKMASSTLQFVNDIKQDLADSCGKDNHNETRTAVNKTIDVQKIAEELVNTIETNSKFKDPILAIDCSTLNKWITDQTLLLDTIFN